MARRRMVPTHFFRDPDIMNLSNKDTQLILIGLILAADDEGREVAHAGMLGREMDYPAEQIEAALADLVANDLLLLYQVGKHRYYQLTRWSQWQTLGGRITPSRHPAPPEAAESETEDEQHAGVATSGKTWGKVGENLGKSRGNSHIFPDQENLTESNQREGEGNAPPGGHQRDHPPNVVPFPTFHPDASDAGGVVQGNDVSTLTRQVARILRLPVTEALTRLVAEYAPYPSLSLLGEADAAREWLDNPERNDRHQRASPAFFRRWLKREQEAMERRHSALQHQATGTGGAAPPATRGAPASPAPVPRSPNLMHLADDDQRARGEKR
jgi:hypothetical protein